MSLASYFCSNHQSGRVISYVKFTLSFSQPMLHIILHLSTLTFIHCFIALSLLLWFLKFASSRLEKSSTAEKENSTVRMKRGQRAKLVLCQPAHALWLYTERTASQHMVTTVMASRQRGGRAGRAWSAHMSEERICPANRSCPGCTASSGSDKYMLKGTPASPC